MPPPLSGLPRYELNDLITLPGDLDQLLRDLHGITRRMLRRHVQRLSCVWIWRDPRYRSQ